MGLVDKQWKFVKMVSKLITYADSLGYKLTFGDAYRDKNNPTGHPKSLHRKRLAVDFNLFIDGKYDTDGSGHKILHDYWDELGGSERIEKDLNHYSLEHGGMR